MARLLVADPHDDFRDLVCFYLEGQLGSAAECIRVNSFEEAQELIRSSDPFRLIVCGQDLGVDCTNQLKKLLTENSKTVLVSINTGSKGDIIKFLETPIADLRVSLGLARSEQSEYFAISGAKTFDIQEAFTDIYLKLSDEKYVKIFNQGHQLDEKDVQRFTDKKIEHFYVRRDGLEAYVSAWSLILKDSKQIQNAVAINRESLEVVAEVQDTLSFTPEMQEMTKANVLLAVKAIRTALKESNLLEMILDEKNEYISSHSVCLAHVACAISGAMGWVSDQTFYKLSLAAFLHDIALRDQELAKIQTLKELEEVRSSITQARVSKYLAHPDAAAQIVLGFSDVPPEVDLIIRQHHERPDGSGFPQKLDDSQIAPLAAVFIVAHELQDFFFKNPNRRSVGAFLNSLGAEARRGQFRAIIAKMTDALVVRAGEPRQSDKPGK